MTVFFDDFDEIEREGLCDVLLINAIVAGSGVEKGDPGVPTLLLYPEEDRPSWKPSITLQTTS